MATNLKEGFTFVQLHSTTAYFTMKKNFPLFLCLFLASLLSAQSGAKKYLLIEHFTNSRCGVCASKNPAFYNLIGQAQYAPDIHHVSIHPVFPYSNCVFYQANTVENTAWTAQYPVQGTPTIALNGALQNPSTPILTEAKLQTFLGQTSPLSLQVTEAGPNNARTVQVKARAWDEIPAGNYKIFVAIAEKTINQQTPNGESVHRDVFRKMLTAVAGDPFEVPAPGETKEFNYQFSIPAGWNADEVFVLAFVKEVDTKQVLNSGTRFDPVLSNTDGPIAQALRLFPNPASTTIWADVDETPQSVEVFSVNGQRLSASFSNNGNTVSIPTESLPRGIYYVKIAGENTVYTGKFVKQ